MAFLPPTVKVNYSTTARTLSRTLAERTRLNEDFLQIVNFAERNHIRLCRRDCGDFVSEVVAIRNWILANAREKGDINGGKAANLNLAFRSSDDRFKWFIILDSDSMLPERTLHEMVTIGVSGDTRKRSVGFVQSILLSQNCNESSVSHALTLIDELYYRAYFKVKASVGVVSNFGHGVLISRVAWEATKGFPLEISEDLAWANELALTGKFINYYAECHTLEGKPRDWRAFKVQRDRWAKGTTLLLKKQFWALWKTKNMCFSEKMDLSYDMMSYSFNALGCCIPVVFMVSGLLGPNGMIVFKTLIPIFYFSLLIDNIFLPLHSIHIALSGNIGKSWDVIKSVPIVSIYMGGISSQVLTSVGKAFLSGRFVFQVTPKLKDDNRESFWSIIKDNKICYLLFFINGWVAISALDFYPPIVPLLAISPICYFFAPIFGSHSIKT
jgi:cellulose synthase/poly-beta-1,6-N-acetylglucosamine synthase-like glycosyltransferase